MTGLVFFSLVPVWETLGEPTVCLCVNSGRKAHMLGTVMTWSERYQMAGDKGVNVSVAGRIEGGDIAQGRGGKFGRPGRPSRKLTRPPHPPPSNVNQEYDVFHLFWDALQKREEKKKKVEQSKSAY